MLVCISYVRSLAFLNNVKVWNEKVNASVVLIKWFKVNVMYMLEKSEERNEDLNRFRERERNRKKKSLIVIKVAFISFKYLICSDHKLMITN